MTSQLEILRVLDGLEAMQADLKEAPITMELIRDARQALMNQLRLSVYLVECNAATLESMPKSWSRAQKDRFAEITKLGFRALKAPGYGPHQEHRFGYSQKDNVKAAIERSERALEDYAKSVKTKA